MSTGGASAVGQYSSSIQIALAEAREAKPLGTIDPALASQDVHVAVEWIQAVGAQGNRALNDARKDYAAIETACRDIFYKLLVRIPTRLVRTTTDWTRHRLK